MKRFVVLLLVSLFYNYVYAQIAYQSYVDGTPATIIKKIDVEGTEMLYDKWLPTTVKTQSGKEYENVMVKYNLLEDVPYFLSKGDITMIFSTPIKEFVIENNEKAEKRIFRANFPNHDKYNALTFYEVLVDGNVKLLKKQQKKITENRAYNAATLVKSIVDNINYFVFVDNQLIPLKKDKKFFQLLPGNTDATVALLNDKDTNLRSEEDLIKLIKTFN